jgi:hypothetical protein
LPADSSASCVEIKSHVYTAHSSNMLADALEALDEHERKTIRAWLSRDTIKIDAALEEAHGKAEELQDQADKLVRFIDKFKSVGDAVANIDPVHIGLPWAGIRSILEVY